MIIEISYFKGKSRNKLNPQRKLPTTTTNKRQSMSMTSLGGSRPTSNSTYSDTFTEEPITKFRSTTDIKLQPIVNKKSDSDISTDLFTSTTESIKARLSAKHNVRINEIEATSNKLENIHITNDHNELPNELQQKSIYTLTRQSSSTKLEKLPNAEQNFRATTSDHEIHLDKSLGDYCAQAIISTVNSFNEITAQHKDKYETSKTETENLMRALKKTDEVHAKLRNNSLTDIELPENDVDIINKIWNDEVEFRKQNNNRTTSEKTKNALDVLNKTTDRNGNITNSTKESVPNVSLESKKKLLATLKAIDNGEILEEDMQTLKSKKSNILNELFGNLN